MVRYVVDGDTIRLNDDKKLRLFGVNTPKLDSSDVEEKLRAELAKSLSRTFFHQAPKLA